MIIQAEVPEGILRVPESWTKDLPSLGMLFWELDFVSSGNLETGIDSPKPVEMLPDEILYLVKYIDEDFRQFKAVPVDVCTIHSMEMRFGNAVDSILLKNKWLSKRVSDITGKPQKVTPFKSKSLTHRDLNSDDDNAELVYTLSDANPTICWEGKFWVPDRILKQYEAEPSGRTAAIAAVLKAQTAIRQTYHQEENVLFRANPLRYVHAKNRSPRLFKTDRVFFRDEVYIESEE